MRAAEVSPRVYSRRRLVLEPLEPRLLLDGNVLVAVSGGDVFIFGDGASNDISIGRDGDFLVVSGSGTSVNGTYEGDVYVPLPVRNLNIVMNEGDDDVAVGGLDLRGSLNFDGGVGNDDLAVGACTFGGSLNLAGGLGGDEFAIGSVGVAGSVVIGTGAGEDMVAIGSVGIGGNLNVASSHGLLDLAVGSVGIRGSTAVDGGSGDLTLAIGSVSMGGSLTIQTDDFMDLTMGSVAAGNGINVMAGRWDTQISMGNIRTTNINIETGSALAGQTPMLVVQMADIGLGGSLSVTGGPGFAGLVEAANVRARGSVDVLWEDADGAEIDVLLGGGSPAQQVLAGGNVSVAGYKGEFDVAMQYVAAGGSINLVGNFDTQMQAQYLVARGSLNVNFGPGIGSFLMANGSFGGSLNVTGAGGIEGVQIGYTGVRGNVNVDTGDGSVAALLQGMSIGGNLNLTNGAGTAADYSIVTTTVRRNINLQSNALFTQALFTVAVGGSVNVQTGLGGDEIGFRHSFVRGNVAIRTDGGNDLTGLFNTVVRGSVLLETGSGMDQVALASWIADEGPPPLIVGGSLTVRTGADDDLVEIGGPGGPGETAEFYSSVFVDGGTGIDKLDIEPVNTFTQVPTFINFEIV